MDDLEFRRRALADPHDTSEDFLERMESSDKDDAWVKELKAMDARLESALNIPAPEGLKERILLKQTMTEHRRSRSRWQVGLSMAAGVLVLIGAIVFLQPLIAGKTAQDQILAHIYSEIYHLNDQRTTPFQSVNAMMRHFGGRIEGDGLGKINFAEICDFRTKKAIHLVLEGKMGPVTIMIVPSLDIDSERPIDDIRFKGYMVPTTKGSLSVVGEEGEDIMPIVNDLRDRVVWNI